LTFGGMNYRSKHYLHSILILLSFLLLAYISNAQPNPVKGKLTGMVTDATTKLPVDFATVSIFKSRVTSPFNGISTDEKGNFVIDKLAEGESIVRLPNENH